jgi:hypothetical protein
MQDDRCGHLLSQPQLFIRVGNDRYAIIDHPRFDVPMYVWSETEQHIVPYRPNK